MRTISILCLLMATVFAGCSARVDNNQLTEYTACGCGCCGETGPIQVCLNESDSLSDIIAADQKMSKSSSCAVVGCSIGTRYSYCN
ncbi:MAG TPA: hypothetical protein VK158_02630 [Acidobacteriota bacterium]|nr:hypothetical protein [Acidobacteriota bacterium]